MFKNIAVPLDGSPFAEAALPMATQLARSAKARLHLVFAHEPKPVLAAAGELPDTLPEACEPRELRYLAETATAMTRFGVGPVESHATSGVAGPELCEVVTRLGVDLLVMATHGRGAMRRFWLGSVADYLVRHLSIPVLLVHPDRLAEVHRGRPIRRILVALDLSREAESVLEPVTALAQLTQAHVTLIHALVPDPALGVAAVTAAVAPDPELLASLSADAQRKLDAVASRLRERGISVATRISVGLSRAGTLLAALDEDRFDVLALATHAGGARRLLLGSVADHVVRGASKPVLVVRPPVTG